MMKNFLRQRQNDYFSVRFKSTGGNFTVEQLEHIQKIAEDFGKSYIHITSRQEISVPFIKADDIPAVEEIIANKNIRVANIGAGLKTIIACQGNQICPSAFIDTVKISENIETRCSSYKFPKKFRIAITGCNNNCMKVNNNNIGIKGGIEPEHILERCIFCGGCAKVCPTNAIKLDRHKKRWNIDRNLCINCGKCVKRCTAALRGKSVFLIYLSGKKSDILIYDEESLYKFIDSVLESHDIKES